MIRLYDQISGANSVGLTETTESPGAPRSDSIFINTVFVPPY